MEEGTSQDPKGTFAEADEETLKKRRIVKVVGMKKKATGVEDGEENKKTNPFAGLLSTKPTSPKSDDKKKSKTPLEKLQQFYKKFNPTKIDTCVKLAKKYEGNEDILFDKLFEYYFATPAASARSTRGRL